MRQVYKIRYKDKILSFFTWIHQLESFYNLKCFCAPKIPLLKDKAS